MRMVILSGCVKKGNVVSAGEARWLQALVKWTIRCGIAEQGCVRIRLVDDECAYILGLKKRQMILA
jgi:hypothetical protein